MRRRLSRQRSWIRGRRWRSRRSTDRTEGRRWIRSEKAGKKSLCLTDTEKPFSCSFGQKLLVVISCTGCARFSFSGYHPMISCLHQGCCDSGVLVCIFRRLSRRCFLFFHTRSLPSRTCNRVFRRRKYAGSGPFACILHWRPLHKSIHHRGYATIRFLRLEQIKAFQRRKKFRSEIALSVDALTRSAS